MLTLIARRISATRARHADLGYADPEELLGELAVVQDSLLLAEGNRQAYGSLQGLIWQIETGFHLAELEVRQHSAVHARTLAALEAGKTSAPKPRKCLRFFVQSHSCSVATAHAPPDATSFRSRSRRKTWRPYTPSPNTREQTLSWMSSRFSRLSMT